jgi:type I restriction enzyme R subunit
MVDLIAARDPDQMTESQRIRLVSMVAAYTNVNISSLSIIKIEQANSSRIRLEMPREGAEKLIAGYQAQDPKLAAFFEDIAVKGERAPEMTLLPTMHSEPGSLAPAGILRIEAAYPELLKTGTVTDTSEKGLEDTIFNSMTGFGWIPGSFKDFDRDYALDLKQFIQFINDTQLNLVEALHLNTDNPNRQKFLARVTNEITSRGITDVLRKGIKHGKYDVDHFYGTPSPGNQKAASLFA